MQAIGKIAIVVVLGVLALAIFVVLPISAIDKIAIVVMLGVLAFAIFVVLPWRIKIATYGLIRLMREKKATSADKALTTEQLGIRPRTIFTLRPKDFKPEAIGMLMRANIVEITDAGKYYLVEAKMVGTKLERLLAEDPEQKKFKLPFS